MGEHYKRKPMKTQNAEHQENTMEFFIDKCINKNKKTKILGAMNSLYQFVSFFLKKNSQQKFSSRAAFKMLFLMIIIGLTSFSAGPYPSNPSFPFLEGASRSDKDMVLENMAFFMPPYGSETLQAGSIIIDMGQVPQTFNNTLKGYGLVWYTTSILNIPVKWVINPLKAKDGTDFTYNNVNYKGAPFIIPGEFITPAIATAIQNWDTNNAGVP